MKNIIHKIKIKYIKYAIYAIKILIDFMFGHKWGNSRYAIKILIDLILKYAIKINKWTNFIY